MLLEFAANYLLARPPEKAYKKARI